ncbi:MAG: hypothetical protein K9G49_08905 [Taibaiella sp.]|nr:hypothetical protein [Taibaiella sp.]
MKKPTQSLFALAITAALFVSSCGKNYDPGPGPTPVATNKTQLNSLFKEFRSTPEIKCVTAGIPQTVVFSKGTKLTFYPNSFKTAAGVIITSGTVCLEVIEMYKPGDMIANRATTTDNNRLLTSGGQVKIRATKDGQEVYANKYGIGFRQPGASSQPMMLFYGNTNNEDSVTTWTTDTTKINRGSFSEFTLYDTTGSAATQAWYHQFDSCTDFNWINCDYFFNNTAPKTNIYVSTGDVVFNKSNTSIFIVFPSINAVSRAYTIPGSETFTGYNFPTGLGVNIIMMSKVGNDYYYTEQNGLTVTADMSVTATPTKQSLDYIKTKLGAL